MSSFLVLRASSSRRTLTSLPAVDYASNPSRSMRRRTITHSSILLSRRSFSSSSPLHADESSSSAQARKEYDDNSIRTTPEKRRIMESISMRTGEKPQILSELTYPPLSWSDYFLEYMNDRRWINIRRHRKHRKYRDTISRDNGSLIEEKDYLKPSGWLADLPEISPMYKDEAKAQEWRELTERAGTDWKVRPKQFIKFGIFQFPKYLLKGFAHPIKTWARFLEDRVRWQMNRGRSADAHMTSRPAVWVKNRYPEELQRVSEVWKQFNEAQAKRDTKAINRLSMFGAHRDAHIVMSSNRVVDWKSTRDYTPPQMLWLRVVVPQKGVDRAIIQLAVQFDGEQRVTYVEPKPREETDQMFVRDPSKKMEPWKLDEYHRKLTEERYHLDTEAKERVPSEIRFANGKHIVPLSATEGLAKRITTSRVIDNVVFYYDTEHKSGENDPPRWKVLDRIQVTQPHYMMEPEKWEDFQTEYMEKEEKIGMPAPYPIHHISQGKWLSKQREKEKKGIKDKPKKKKDPVKARKEREAKRIEAWRKLDVQDQRERALLAMSGQRHPHRQDYAKRLNLARKTRGGDILSHLDTAAAEKPEDVASSPKPAEPEPSIWQKTKARLGFGEPSVNVAKV